MEKFTVVKDVGPKNEMIGCRLTSDNYDKVLRIAENRGVTKSKVISQAVSFALDNM